MVYHTRSLSIFTNMMMNEDDDYNTSNTNNTSTLRRDIVGPKMCVYIYYTYIYIYDTYLKISHFPSVSQHIR